MLIYQKTIFKIMILQFSSGNTSLIFSASFFVFPVLLLYIIEYLCIPMLSLAPFFVLCTLEVFLVFAFAKRFRKYIFICVIYISYKSSSDTPSRNIFSSSSILSLSFSFLLYWTSTTVTMADRIMHLRISFRMRIHLFTSFLPFS